MSEQTECEKLGYELGDPFEIVDGYGHRPVI